MREMNESNERKHTQWSNELPTYDVLSAMDNRLVHRIHTERKCVIFFSSAAAPDELNVTSVTVRSASVFTEFRRRAEQAD